MNEINNLNNYIKSIYDSAIFTQGIFDYDQKYERLQEINKRT